MSLQRNLQLGLVAAALVAVGAVGGVALDRATRHAPAATGSPPDGRTVLYWYDPMVPGQHFPRPGRSPFMDMQLVPRYADTAASTPGVAIDALAAQNLGVRLAPARRGTLANDVTAAGVVDYDQRSVSVVQARAGGFVQRVYARAPGDVIRAGAPLADLLIPAWGPAQTEYLAVRQTQDARLIAAARQRLLLIGMPEGLVAAVERRGRPISVLIVVAPTGGVIRTLGVRGGMSVSQGQTLAEISGLSTVWLNVAIPEAISGQVHVGQTAIAALTAYPGERFTGRLTALLPEASADSRTITGRIELSNPGGRLRPGMYASVQLGGASAPALLVPSEAVIRTGRRNLVMLAQPGGRYRAAEIQVGREVDGQTEVLAGLAEGESVVASGQFLIDSEASLSGVQARPIAPAANPMTRPGLIEGVGRIEQLTTTSVTLSHEPIPAAGWPAMTMTFALPTPMIGRGHSVGERVRFAFDQAGGAPTVRRMTSVDAAR